MIERGPVQDFIQYKLFSNRPGFVVMQYEKPGAPKGVFFDLYGTLLILGDMKRAWSDWMDVFHGTLQAQGLSLTREDFGSRCHQFFGQDEPLARLDGLTVFERRIRRVVESI